MSQSILSGVSRNARASKSVIDATESSEDQYLSLLRVCAAPPRGHYRIAGRQPHPVTLYLGQRVARCIDAPDLRKTFRRQFPCRYRGTRNGGSKLLGIWYGPTATSGGCNGGRCR